MKEEIQLGQTRIVIVGTGHVFQESVDLVKTTILNENPDFVALELDLERLHALQAETAERPGFRQMLRMGFKMAILGSVLSYFQSKVGKETGVFPGAEMLEAARTAQDVGATIKLIDRSVVITLQRLISKLSTADMLKMLLYMLFPSKIDIDSVDEEVVDSLTEELYKVNPSAYQVLIEERDQIMAENITHLSGTVVVVVGAGHVKGIKEHLIERYKNNQKEAA